MRLVPLSVVSLLSLASGCAGTHWSVVDARPLPAIHVAPAEVQGPLDPRVVAQRRTLLIGELRAHGYRVLEDAAPGVPTLKLKVTGTVMDDTKMHAPDDSQHHIFNDLKYRFVVYEVDLDVDDGNGHVLVYGSARSVASPETAMAELTTRLIRDVPASSSTYAVR